jgi:hypothetical protein
MSAAALRSGRPSGRAAAVGSERRLSTCGRGRVVAFYEGASGQRGCIGGHVLRDLFGSKRRSKPSKMSDRSASLRRCLTTASGRESFPQVGRIPRIRGAGLHRQIDKFDLSGPSRRRTTSSCRPATTRGRRCSPRWRTGVHEKYCTVGRALRGGVWTIHMLPVSPPAAKHRFSL